MYTWKQKGSYRMREETSKDFGNPLRIISDRGTAFTAKEFEDYCEQRSIKSTPFEVLFGTKMKNKKDLRMKEIIEQEIIKQFDEDREMLRKESRRQLIKIPEENRRRYDLRRKRPRMYKKGDLVAIKRTQFGGGLKLLKKYFGPYVVVQVNPNDRYEVKKSGYHDGPQSTSKCAEYMKPWIDGIMDTWNPSRIPNRMAECRIVNSLPYILNSPVYHFS
uniref:Uncharacterized protein LOC114343798 n=1 Tax=Diabrotica virgifera virgifera TaxID=50390 RepID=A0A6P7GYC8_DIAVI